MRLLVVSYMYFWKAVSPITFRQTKIKQQGFCLISAFKNYLCTYGRLILQHDSTRQAKHNDYAHLLPMMTHDEKPRDSTGVLYLGRKHFTVSRHR